MSHNSHLPHHDCVNDKQPEESVPGINNLPRLVSFRVALALFGDNIRQL
jgi:hypothetical protein